MVHVRNRDGATVDMSSEQGFVAARREEDEKRRASFARKP